MRITHYDLPAHWASALINGDLSGYDSDDLEAIRLFTADMVATYGSCRCLDMGEDHWLTQWHDARSFGVLACDTASFAFDITRAKAEAL